MTYQNSYEQDIDMSFYKLYLDSLFDWLIIFISELFYCCDKEE